MRITLKKVAHALCLITLIAFLKLIFNATSPSTNVLSSSLDSLDRSIDQEHQVQFVKTQELSKQAHRHDYDNRATLKLRVHQQDVVDLNTRNSPNGLKQLNQVRVEQFEIDANNPFQGSLNHLRQNDNALSSSVEKWFGRREKVFNDNINNGILPFKSDNNYGATVEQNNRFKHVKSSPSKWRSSNEKIAQVKNSMIAQTVLDDVFIAVKTTYRYHQARVKLLLETWISLAPYQTYIFTDQSDKDLSASMPDGHVVVTSCVPTHSRDALCCKMAEEYNFFLKMKRRWFCHFDDDNYVNVGELVKLLRQYNHTSDWYLGRPSIQYPIESMDRQTNKKVSFWFATGGAGFCISLSLALKMSPHARDERFMAACNRIRLPDDCTMGFIIGCLLKKQLTVIKTFHSHLESLWAIDPSALKNQITYSYSMDTEHANVINVAGLPSSKDPTRLVSLHCILYPGADICKRASIKQ